MLTGFGIILVAMGTSMILQTIVADEKRGRVMSFFPWLFSAWSARQFRRRRVAHRFGAGHTLFAGGACCVIGGGVLWRQMPRLRATFAKSTRGSALSSVARHFSVRLAGRVPCVHGGAADLRTRNAAGYTVQLILKTA